MPYDVKKNHPKCPKSKPYAVVSRTSGGVMGCHKSAAGARRQQSAVYVNAPPEEEKQMDDELLEKAAEGKGGWLVTEEDGTKHLPTTTNGKPDHRLMGAAWAALHGGYRGQKYQGPKKAEAIKKLRALYKREDMDPPADKQLSDEIEAEKMYDSSDGHIYVPSRIVSFAELDQWQKQEEVQYAVREALEAYKQMSDNILWFQEPDVDKVGLLRRLTDELDNRLKKLLDDGMRKDVGNLLKAIVRQPEPGPVKRGGLFVWKEGELYRWLAVYSNKYRDEDNPPEIIASDAHRAFVKAVDDGEVPFPELWHFHVPGTRWGKSDLVAFDETTGFTLASGFVDTGHEKEAEALASLDEPVAVSHGMKEVAYDPNEADVITRYTTVEISDLPMEYAANKLTGFQVLKEGEHSMGIPEIKKAYLKKVGLSDEKINEIDQDLSDKATAAEAAGLQSKQTEQERRAGGQTTPAAEAPAPAPAPEPEPEPEPVEETEAEPVKAVTREEVAEAIVDAVKPIVESVAQLTDIVGKMAKSEDERIKEQVALTPSASIAAMVMKSLSATGKPETLVDGRTSLAKDGPVETKGKAGQTGIGFLDDMLAQ